MTPDTCEAGKETTTALMKILPFGGGAASGVQLCRRGLFQTGNVRGGIKKKNCFFFTFRQKGGGSRPILKILIRKYSDFFDQRGGVSPNPKGFYQKN